MNKEKKFDSNIIEPNSKDKDIVDDPRFESGVVYSKRDFIYRLSALANMNPRLRESIRPVLDWAEPFPDDAKLTWKLDKKTGKLVPQRLIGSF
jgi:hypothetical protein